VIREVNSEEEETIFNHQRSIQYQTAKTTSLSKNEIRVTISKLLNAKKVPEYNLEEMTARNES
jgi:hypothetical protein